MAQRESHISKLGTFRVIIWRALESEDDMENCEAACEARIRDRQLSSFVARLSRRPPHALEAQGVKGALRRHQTSHPPAVWRLTLRLPSSMTSCAWGECKLGGPYRIPGLLGLLRNPAWQQQRVVLGPYRSKMSSPSERRWAHGWAGRPRRGS